MKNRGRSTGRSRRLTLVVAGLIAFMLAGCLSESEPRQRASDSEAGDGTNDDFPSSRPIPRSMEFDPAVELGWAPGPAEPLIRANDSHAVVVNFGALWSSPDGSAWTPAAPLICPIAEYSIPPICPPGRGTPQSNAMGVADDELVWDGEAWYRIGTYDFPHDAPIQRALPDLSSFGQAADVMDEPVDRLWAVTNPWLAIGNLDDEGFAFTTSPDGETWNRTDLIPWEGEAIPGQLVQGHGRAMFAFMTLGDSVGLVEFHEGEWALHRVPIADAAAVTSSHSTTSFPAVGVLANEVILLATVDTNFMRTTTEAGATMLMLATGPDAANMTELQPFPGPPRTAMSPWTHDLGDAIAVTWMEAPQGLQMHVPQPWHIMYAEYNGSWTEPVDVLGEPAFTGFQCPIGSATMAGCKLALAAPVDFYSMTSLRGQPIIAYAVPAERGVTIHAVAMAPT